MRKPVKDVLVGTAIGTTSMLPGASGATMAVIFGVYERLVSDLADLRGRLLRDVRFIVPMGVGILMGMLACAFGLDLLMENLEVPTMFFFAALIVSQVPDIKRLGDDGGPTTRANIAAFVCGTIVMISFLFIGSGKDVTVTGASGAALMFLVGVVLALSKLAPGVSGSTVLLALGMFAPMVDAMTDLDLGFLLPIGLGLLAGILGFSKMIDHFMRHNRKSTYSAILGLTVGSVVTVGIQAFQGLSGLEMAVESAAGVISGLVCGLGLSIVAGKYARKTISDI